MQNGNSALHIAVGIRGDKAKIVEMLHAAGVEINLQNQVRDTIV